MKIQKFSAGVWCILMFGLAFLFVNQPVFADATIIYVNAGASAGGDGRSWGTAYPYLQDALDETNANGGSAYEIWVAQGLYYPDQDSDGDHLGGVVSETFRISYNNVQLYGGFTGMETARAERDWEANLTVLSGDIDQNDTSNANGIVEDTDNLVGENAYHVLFFDGVTNEPITTTTVLDGFVITAGVAHGNSALNHDDGGGLQCAGNGSGKECSPTLTNLTFIGNMAVGSGGAIRTVGYSAGKSNPILSNITFTKNTALVGGAMYNGGNGIGSQSSPILTHVTFSENTSSGSGGAMYNYGYYSGKSNPVLTDVTFSSNTAGGNGGAMSNNGDQGNSNPVLTYVTFTNNVATGSANGSDGGAIYNYGDNGNANPVLTHVLFDGNTADDAGGAMHNHAWETAGDSNPVLNDVIFINNSAYAGGAMYNIATYEGRTNPTLTNVIFSNNTATYGGALLNYGYHGHSNPILVNVIFNGNSAYYGGAMYTDGDHGNSAPLLVNVTIYGNTATWGGAMYTSSYLGTDDPRLKNVIMWGNTATNGANMVNSWASISIAYSIIEGGLDGAGILNDSGSVFDGGGNLDANPQFVNPLIGNFHLQPTSPAIDAGDNEALPVEIVLDLDNHPRFVDYPPEGGSGNGTSPLVDMGAYELQTETFIYLPFVMK
ncbi:MAG: hypothetical protein H6636_08750 [Anaerolineales bacterium]|nr:hypothetical protein [Anaerolineales bacterium]